MDKKLFRSVNFKSIKIELNTVTHMSMIIFFYFQQKKKLINLFNVHILCVITAYIKKIKVFILNIKCGFFIIPNPRVIFGKKFKFSHVQNEISYTAIAVLCKISAASNEISMQYII